MAGQPESNEHVVITSDSTFEADVFERSQLGLVLVDFWAQWCQPCRLLGPVLEKLAAEYEGAFTLVKAETEHNERAAGQFQVSSIPVVFAVLNGNLVNRLDGLVPESEIRSWIGALLQQSSLLEIENMVEIAPPEAENRLRQHLLNTPHDTAASILLVQSLAVQGKDGECQELIVELERRGFLEPQLEKIKASLALKRHSSMSVEKAQADAAAASKDLELQLKLAEALVGHQRYEEAFEICLNLVASDRKNTGERARQLMVEVFHALPDDSELTGIYRRKLSLALY